MAILQVKNLPDDLHAALQSRARSLGMSMSDLVTDLLRRELQAPTVEEWLAAHPAPQPGLRADFAYAAIDEVRVEYSDDSGPAQPPGDDAATTSRTRVRA